MTLSKQLNIDPVAARVLRNRGLENAADMGRFLKNSEDICSMIWTKRSNLFLILSTGEKG